MKSMGQTKNLVKLSSFLFAFCLPLYISSACSVETTNSGEIIKQGIIEAFTSQNKNSGIPYTFEPSAIYKVADQIYLVNDRPLPKSFFSPVISFSEKLLNKEFIESSTINKIDFPLMIDSFKIESATQSLDNSFIFAATSFTYFRESQPEKDKYNRIIYWPYGKQYKAKIINPSERQGVISSMQVREKITKVLQSNKYPEGPNYFKIEGLSIAPDNKLIFGIRSMGESYKKSTYQFILIEAKITFSFDKNGESKLELSNFKNIYDPSIKQKKRLFQTIPQSIGISSIEYDKKRNGFYILTSFENDSDIGAYLWFYKKGGTPNLILDKQGNPLIFKHKSEGLLIMDDGKLLIIHDDDRETKLVNTGKSSIRRKVNQGIYSIVKLSQKPIEN